MLFPGKRCCFSSILVTIGLFALLYWPEQPSQPIVFTYKAYEVYKFSEEYSGDKPWFFSHGTILPTPVPVESNATRYVSIWPEERPGHDRIVDQLMFVPKNGRNRLKVVSLFDGFTIWGQSLDRDIDIFNGCPVDSCLLSTNLTESRKAHAVIYRRQHYVPFRYKNFNQVWIAFSLECPYSTCRVKNYNMFNWTATYRRDSDIVTPYEKWVYYNESIKQLKTPIKNFAANKTKQVAWFVSNCNSRNGRLLYAKELQKYINVDIFGACGRNDCPRSKQYECFAMLRRDYKFYLSFENSNCNEYITEKFFVNGLGNDVLPIVMGARPQDYELVAPMKSYIHVDDYESPKQLAEYLHKLDSDDNLYNEYFRWKGTGEFINTYFFCRVCALLHDQYPIKSYRDINEWWMGKNVCRRPFKYGLKSALRG